MIIVINDDVNTQVETRARKKRLCATVRERVIKDVKTNVSATEHIC